MSIIFNCSPWSLWVQFYDLNPFHASKSTEMAFTIWFSCVEPSICSSVKIHLILCEENPSRPYKSVSSEEYKLDPTSSTWLKLINNQMVYSFKTIHTLNSWTPSSAYESLAWYSSVYLNSNSYQGRQDVIIALSLIYDQRRIIQ